MNLPYLTTTYAVHMEEPLTLPPYSGTAIRGALGESLRAEVCTTGAATCAGCPNLGSCPFGVVWEGGIQADLPKRFDSPPRPYVFSPPVFEETRRFGRFETLRFDLTLFGTTTELARTITSAAEEISAVGKGHGRGIVRVERLQGVKGLLNSTRSDSMAPKVCRVEFLTPIHLKANGKVLDVFDAEVFTSRLVSRLELLSVAYADGAELDYQRLADLSKYVVVQEAKLRVHTFERKSRRQDRKIPMEGFTGSVTLKGVHPDLLSVWKLGELVHVGKQATFGFGKIRVEEVGIA